MIAKGDYLDNPESLPKLTIDKLVRQDSSILIVAPHPDDETLGCGGAIALCRQQLIPILVLVVSDGTRSHPNSLAYPPVALKKLRERESLAALAILGVAPEMVTFFGLPDGAVDISSQSSKAIAFCHEYLSNLQPSIVFLPWRNDPHEDHRASWQLLTTAMSNLTYSPRIIEYPIWDWDTQQRGNFPNSIAAWRLDISHVLELKKSAIAEYHSQISNLIHDDPEGFRLTPQMLQNFTQPWEIYIEVL